MRLVQVLCGALAYAGVAHAVATYHVTVDASDELCFFEDLQANDPLGMSFQVTFGGFLDIDVEVSLLWSVCEIENYGCKCTRSVHMQYCMCYGCKDLRGMDFYSSDSLIRQFYGERKIYMQLYALGPYAVL